ncbi:hypothetical protein LTR85_002803 [Meristemomyces frigidus]|nr:hypothetical protein LTR85_002803 [Meristemomyces frigidus]
MSSIDAVSPPSGEELWLYERVSYMGPSSPRPVKLKWTHWLLVGPREFLEQERERLDWIKEAIARYQEKALLGQIVVKPKRYDDDKASKIVQEWSQKGRDMDDGESEGRSSSR